MGFDLQPERNLALLAAGALLLIVYGSLYPFQWHWRPGNPAMFLLTSWSQLSSRGDLLANVILYVPVTFFAACFLSNLPPVRRVLWLIASSMCLSAGLELAQFYDLGRQSALSDVYANTVGACLGGSFGTLISGKPTRAVIRKFRPRPFVIFLLACWAGYRLFPYVPVIDLHKYLQAVRPLITGNGISLVDSFRHFASWLAIALLLEKLTGSAWSRRAVWIVFVAVTGARIFILDIVLSRPEVVGGLLALLWWMFLSTWRFRLPIVTILFAVGVVVRGLIPFQFHSPPHPLAWVPFGGFLKGSLEINLLSLFEKVFLYGTMVWLSVRAGIRWMVATFLGAVLVFAIRLVQTFLPDRSADLTDVILVLLVSAAARLLGADPAGRRNTDQPAPLGWWNKALRPISRALTLNDTVQPVDIIVVLAGRMDRKVYGLELYNAGIAPRVVLSVGRFEVSRMRSLGLDRVDDLVALRDATPREERHFLAVVGESGTQIQRVRLPRWSTYGEALGLHAFLQNQGVRRVMVVSTGIHLRRAALAFNAASRGTGLKFIYCPVPARQPWPPPGSRYVMQESLKIVGYYLILCLPPRLSRFLMRVG